MAKHMTNEGHQVVWVNIGLGILSYLRLPLLYIRYLLTIWRGDIILLNTGSGHALSLKMLPAILIGRIMGKKCILQFAGGAVVDNAADWRLAKKLALRLSHFVVVPTRQIKQALDRHGIQANYRIIPHIVDIEPFAHPNHSNKTIVAVKSLSSFSGHDLLLEVFELVKKEVPDAKFVILGDGTTRGQLEALVEQKKLDDVYFKGNVPHHQIPAELQAAAILVHGTRYESFGIALVEAMAAGLPVVAFSVGGIPSVVPDGKAGFLIAYGDTQTFADRVIHLLTNPNSYAEFSQYARQHSAQFSWDMLKNQWFELYGISTSSFEYEQRDHVNTQIR